MIHESWEFSDEGREESVPLVEGLKKSCPEMLVLQTQRLVALAQANVPEMSQFEAELLVKCLISFDLPEADTVPTEDFPKLIAHNIRESFVVEFGAEHLAAEKKKFGSDPEWQRYFQKMPEMAFVRRLEVTLNPLTAYLLIAMIECYWQVEFDTKSAKLSDFFNIRD